MNASVPCPHCDEAIDVSHIGGRVGFQHRGQPCIPYLAWCEQFMATFLQTQRDRRAHADARR